MNFVKFLPTFWCMCYLWNNLIQSILSELLNSSLFSSPGQRPCELLPSLGIRRHLFVLHRKLSHLNFLLWTKLSQAWQGGSLSKLCPDSPALHSKWAQNLTAATWQGVVFRVFLWNFSFSQFIPIMQIRYILIKDHI